MPSYRPRLWFGLGLSVLTAGLPQSSRAADPSCGAPAELPLGEGGEAGEGGGEGGPATPGSRALLLDRIAAQIAAAAERRAVGDAESADILVAAATDEGPARLARRAEGADPALEAGLAPLAAAPADAPARDQAARAVAAALGRLPGLEAPAARLQRAAGLAGLALEAYAAALDCGQVADRAAYAEARALAERARDLVAGVPGRAAQETAGEIRALAAALPAAPPKNPPAVGQVSALVSRAVLAASDPGP